MGLSRVRDIQTDGRAAVSGFMYASVGSYMARVIRIFDMRFSPIRPFGSRWRWRGRSMNFFAHHFLPDIRWILFAATLLVYGRTRIWFRLSRWYLGCRCHWPPS